MMGQEARTKIEVEASNGPAPFTVVKDPVTEVPFLLVDPYLTVVKHKIDCIDCDDAPSFVSAVKAVAGDNKLVTVNSEGHFSYQDELMGGVTAEVRFWLKPHETVRILALDDYMMFTQKTLLRWNARHPGTLLPDGADPIEVWESLSAYKASETKTVQAEHSDDVIALSVERRDNSSDGRKIPRLWTARSPLYEGYDDQEVMLRLDIEHPEADQESGRMSGQLNFVFHLWTPSASEIIAAALNDAQAIMEHDLGDEFIVIRGELQ